MDPDPINYPLHAAVARGAAKAELSMLVDAGCEVNGWDNNGNCALHIAAWHGKTAAAAALLQLGAKHSNLNAEGKLARDIARERGHVDASQYLADLEPAQPSAPATLATASFGSPGVTTAFGSPGVTTESTTSSPADPWASAFPDTNPANAAMAKDPWDVAWMYGLDDDDNERGSTKHTRTPSATSATSSFLSTVPSEDNGEDGKTARWRQAALSEIISSEQTYVAELEVLVDVYYERFNEPDAPVDQATVEKLFSNVQNILVLNQRLLTELLHKQSKGESFIEALRNFTPYLRMYQTYINNYEGATMELKRLMERSDVAAFLRVCDDSHQKQLTLRDYLVVPVQRIPRYKLLVSEVLKHTPVATMPEENAMLEEALRNISTLAESINNDLRRHQARSKVIAIADEVGDDDLVTPTRLFVHEGFLDKISRHGPQRRKFVLFNDLLCYMEPSWGLGHEAYKLNRALPLDEIIVVDRSDAREEFVILSEEKSFACKADSAVEKEDWVSRIRETQAALSGRRNQRNNGRRVSTKVSVMRNGQVRQLDVGNVEQRLLSLASRGKKKLALGAFQSVHSGIPASAFGRGPKGAKLVGSIHEDDNAAATGLQRPSIPDVDHFSAQTTPASEISTRPFPVFRSPVLSPTRAGQPNTKHSPMANATAMPSNPNPNRKLSAAPRLLSEAFQSGSFDDNDLARLPTPQDFGAHFASNTFNNLGPNPKPVPNPKPSPIPCLSRSPNSIPEHSPSISPITNLNNGMQPPRSPVDLNPSPPPPTVSPLALRQPSESAPPVHKPTHLRQPSLEEPKARQATISVPGVEAFRAAPTKKAPPRVSPERAGAKQAVWPQPRPHLHHRAEP
mmetsp:Transcript_25037/g.78451  ORF Transcript_25037/g.78451 Transcript_25037/m.78451 type:complete len:852 (-) Transcript_25037:136-2691(-)